MDAETFPASPAGSFPSGIRLEEDLNLVRPSQGEMGCFHFEIGDLSMEQFETTFRRAHGILQRALDHPDIVLMEFHFPGMANPELGLLKGGMGDHSQSVGGDTGLGGFFIPVGGEDGLASWHFDGVHPVPLFLRTGFNRG